MRLLQLGNILTLVLALAAGAFRLRLENPPLSIDSAAATKLPLLKVDAAEALCATLVPCSLTCVPTPITPMATFARCAYPFRTRNWMIASPNCNRASSGPRHSWYIANPWTAAKACGRPWHCATPG